MFVDANIQLQKTALFLLLDAPRMVCVSNVWQICIQ